MSPFRVHSPFTCQGGLCEYFVILEYKNEIDASVSSGFERMQNKNHTLLKYNPNFLSRESKVYLNVACYI